MDKADKLSICITTQTVVKSKPEVGGPNNQNVFSLSFKSDDGKRYYVNASVTGQPLVIDSIPGPQYIFNYIIPTKEGAAA